MAVKNMSNVELQQWCRDFNACLASRTWIGDTLDLHGALALCPNPAWFKFVMDIAFTSDPADHRMDGLPEYWEFYRAYYEAETKYLRELDIASHAKESIVVPAQEVYFLTRTEIRTRYHGLLQQVQAQEGPKQEVIDMLVEGRQTELDKCEATLEAAKIEAKAVYDGIKLPALQAFVDTVRAMFTVED